MQINIDGNYSRAAEVLQRGINLIQGTTLDEILDELSQEMQDAIIKHMMDKPQPASVVMPLWSNQLSLRPQPNHLNAIYSRSKS